MVRVLNFETKTYAHNFTYYIFFVRIPSKLAIHRNKNLKPTTYGYKLISETDQSLRSGCAIFNKYYYLSLLLYIDALRTPPADERLTERTVHHHGGDCRMAVAISCGDRNGEDLTLRKTPLPHDCHVIGFLIRTYVMPLLQNRCVHTCVCVSVRACVRQNRMQRKGRD